MKILAAFLLLVLIAAPIHSKANNNVYCTNSPGYWKTHSEFGPAPYDDGWAMLLGGASTGFYGPYQTFYDVLNTPPEGNPWYVLARQYIAAWLNIGEFGPPVPPEVADAFSLANDLFVNFYPEEVTSEDRYLFLGAAWVLEDFNTGVIGPGVCND